MENFDKYEEKGTYHWEKYREDHMYREKTNKIIEYVGEDKKVLDVGCGDGLITEKIGTNNHIVGIDNSDKGIKLARKKCNNVNNLIKTDALDLPFEDKKFDVVVLADVIEHIKEEKRLIKEIARVLKKRGKIIITTPLKREVIEEHHIREYTEEELRESLSSHFEVDSIEIIEEKKFSRKKKIGRFISRFFPDKILPKKVRSRLSKNKTIIYKGDKKC